MVTTEYASMLPLSCRLVRLVIAKLCDISAWRPFRCNTVIIGQVQVNVHPRVNPIPYCTLTGFGESYVPAAARLQSGRNLVNMRRPYLARWCILLNSPVMLNEHIRYWRGPTPYIVQSLLFLLPARG